MWTTIGFPSNLTGQSLEQLLKPGEAMSLYDVAFTAVLHSELGKSWNAVHEPISYHFFTFLIISLHARSCQYHGFW
jgi:hypothetical protein